MFRSKVLFRIKKKILYWMLIAVLFLSITWLHMGSSLSQCSNVVLGQPGDHTAGLIYNTWVHPSSPILGNTTLTNYPYGENLWQPTSVSSIIPSSAHVLLSKVTNTVCGWNLLILIAFLSNALIMFAFILWLTKNSWVSFFAAYAVTYTPYHAFASQGQPAGLFSSIFILALWQFIALWRKPTILKSILLGVTLGFGFYTDGYFILFGGIMFLAFWVACISYGLIVLRGKLSRIKPQIKAFILTNIVCILFLLPLGWINHVNDSQIESYLGSTRGDIQSDAQTYSASPYMYFIPTERTPIIGRYTQEFQERYFKDHGKPGLIFLGFSVIGLASIEAALMYKAFRSKNKAIRKTDSTFFVVWAALILTVLAFWFSLKPKGSIFGFPLHNPSGLIITLTPSWRVFGRLYALVDIGIVTLAGLGLFSLCRKYPLRKSVIIIFSMLFVVLELRSFPTASTTSTFNYLNSPSVYYWLKDNPEIKSIAEYPLDETPQGKYLSDYYTFQTVSGKPMINSLLPNSPEAPLRRSLAGINDPQTLPVLRALGVGLVNIRPLDYDDNTKDIRVATLENKDLERIFTHTEPKHSLDSFLIKPGVIANYALTIPTLKYYQISLRDDGGADFLIGNNTHMSIVRLPNSKDTSSMVNIAFDISADKNRQTILVQNGVVLWSGNVSEDMQNIVVNAVVGYPVIIFTEESMQEIAHITISKLQVLEN